MDPAGQRRGRVSDVKCKKKRGEGMAHRSRGKLPGFLLSLGEQALLASSSCLQISSGDLAELDVGGLSPTFARPHGYTGVLTTEHP